MMKHLSGKGNDMYKEMIILAGHGNYEKESKEVKNTV